jgi:NTP pyrophosphatase (non-canonical NTP hydrolase)
MTKEELQQLLWDVLIEANVNAERLPERTRKRIFDYIEEYKPLERDQK